jgi:hypothetical protein
MLKAPENEELNTIIDRNLKIRNIMPNSDGYKYIINSLQIATNTPIVKNLCYDQKKEVLRYAIELGNKIKYVTSIDSSTENKRLLKKPEMNIPCILHGEMRVGENLLTRLVNAILHAYRDSNGYPEGTGKIQVEKLQNAINLYFGGMDCDEIAKIIADLNKIENLQEGLENPIFYTTNFNITTIGLKSEPIRLSNVRIQKLMEIIDSLIDVAFDLNTPDHANIIGDYKKLFALYKDYSQRLKYRGNFGSQRIDDLQFSLDEMKRHFVHMFGSTAIANYLHIYFSGHMRYFLRFYGNIYVWAQHGFEHKMGAIRCYAQRRTQHGGHAGKGKGFKNFSQAKAMKSYMLRSAAWTIELLGGGFEKCDFVTDCRDIGWKILETIKKTKISNKMRMEVNLIFPNRSPSSDV